MRDAKRPRVDASRATNRPPASAVPLNRYAGYALTPGATIDRVDARSITANDLDERYVIPRRPVVLTGVFERESELRGSARWTDAFLRARCGDGAETTHRVETRDASAGERFGLGKYRAMTFDAFMDKFEAGDGGWYLSAGGKTGAFGAPASALVTTDADAAKDGLLPLRPRSIPESLVPADINLWMGRNGGAPTSSGLHHDYHDNVYVLARGEKRFKVFSPLDAGRMYTVGEIRVVHENGLINYKGSPATLQDGDFTLENGESALERRLREARGEKKRGDNETAGDDEDDDDEEEDDDDGDFGGSDDDNDDDFADFDGVDDYDELNETPPESESDESEDENDGDDCGRTMTDKSDPPSFSRVDYERLDEFPLFKGAISMEFTVSAGEALYLPAGWFHDVSSKETGSGHVAFNYWFHPPPLGARHALWTEDFQRSIVEKKFARAAI